MGDNSTQSVWLKTTVTYQQCMPEVDRRTGEERCKAMSSHEEFNSLPVTSSAQPLYLAVQEHLRQIRSSSKRDSGVATAYAVQICSQTEQIRTKVVRQLRESEVVELPSILSQQCQPLQTTEQLPEAEALTHLFRGAEMAVAVLGPVEKPAGDKASAAVESPGADQYRGTSAVPYSTRATGFAP